MSRDLLFTPVDSSERHRSLFELVHLLACGLFLAYLGTGIAKIASTDFVLATFPGFAAPSWMLVVIGVLEVSAAVMTIIPTTRLLGAGFLALIMSGAMTYHAALGEYASIPVPAAGAFLALLVFRLELSLRQLERLPQPVEADAR